MTWKIEHNEDEKIVRVTAAGDISTEDAFAQAREGIDLILRHGLKGVFADYSAANLLMPISDISRLPEFFDSLALPRETKLAVVLPGNPATMNKYTFFDDVATDRGYVVGLFWEPSQAMAWLKKRPRTGA